MTGFQAIDADHPAAAVLLIMLPPQGRSPGARVRGVSSADLATLQSRLGAAVRVLRIDEASYPAIVRSFAPAQLPTSVLMHHGVELWRHPGLPDAAEIEARLLSRNSGTGAGTTALRTPNPREQAALQ